MAATFTPRGSCKGVARSIVGQPLAALAWTIVRRSVGLPWEAPSFEARDVFVVSLPEILLQRPMATAAQTYEEWLQCETIIGKRPPRGTVGPGRAWVAKA